MSNGSISFSDQRRLSDLGISRDQSSQWQQLAGVPDAEFEAALAGSEEPTINGISKGSRSNPVERDGDTASRLCLWLGHWDRYGLLGQSPASEVVLTMTPETRDDRLTFASSSSRSRASAGASHWNEGDV
jgi:hypothetical protein